MTAQHVYDFLIAQFDCIHGGSLIITGSDQSTKLGVSPTPAVSSSPAPALPTHFSDLFLFLDLEHFKQYPLQL
jgi:hypothetical protein